MSVEINQTICLSDGRTLGYAEYGDLNGQVIFFFHGQPGNRLFHPNLVLTRKAGLRLIIPDRPGYGLSCDDPRRTILDWPRDMQQLANHLGAKRFGVIGFSAGGPYALACGIAFPERVSRLLLISSAPPAAQRDLRKKMPFLIRLNYWMSYLAPELFFLSFRWYWPQARKNPHHFIKMAQAQSSPADQAILNRQEIYAMLLDCWQENLRVESTGYARDAQLLLSDWGFELAAVPVEVDLWWGDQDKNTPLVIQEFFANQLPKSRLIQQPNMGHFGFLQEWDSICALMQTAFLTDRYLSQ